MDSNKLFWTTWPKLVATKIQCLVDVVVAVEHFEAGKCPQQVPGKSWQRSWAHLTSPTILAVSLSAHIQSKLSQLWVSFLPVNSAHLDLCHLIILDLCHLIISQDSLLCLFCVAIWSKSNIHTDTQLKIKVIPANQEKSVKTNPSQCPCRKPYHGHTSEKKILWNITCILYEKFCSLH